MAGKKVYPSKKYINLAVKEKGSGLNPAVAIPAVLLVLVLVALFAKFAVIDRFAKVTEARNALSEYQIQLAAVNARLQDYDKVLEEYQKYSVDWMDDTEKSLVKKTAVIDMVNNEILKNSEIRSLSIEGNTIKADLVGLTLSETSRLIDRLHARKDVADVQLFTATTEEAVDNQVIVSLLVTMILEEGDAE